MARVLLVEDEAAILMLLAEALSDAGHDVIEASTAEAAEAAMARLDGALDILVTDINVGVRGWGFGFARRVRELQPTVPVLYITGDSELHAGASGVPGARTLPKPFTPGELVRAVSDASAPAG